MHALVSLCPEHPSMPAFVAPSQDCPMMHALVSPNPERPTCLPLSISPQAHSACLVSLRSPQCRPLSPPQPGAPHGACPHISCLCAVFVQRLPRLEIHSAHSPLGLACLGRRTAVLAARSHAPVAWTAGWQSGESDGYTLNLLSISAGSSCYLTEPALCRRKS